MTRTPKQARCTNCRQLLKPGAPNSVGSGEIWAHNECPPTSFRTQGVRVVPVVLNSPPASVEDRSIPQASGV